MIVIAGPCSRNISILSVHGPLRVPNHRRVRDDVRAMLQRGERCIVLDLANVPTIDAGGVGELVRTYTMAAAADGIVRIVRPTKWVRVILERVGLAGLLTAEAEAA